MPSTQGYGLNYDFPRPLNLFVDHTPKNKPLVDFSLIYTEISSCGEKWRREGYVLKRGCKRSSMRFPKAVWRNGARRDFRKFRERSYRWVIIGLHSSFTRFPRDFCAVRSFIIRKVSLGTHYGYKNIPRCNMAILVFLGKFCVILQSTSH